MLQVSFSQSLGQNSPWREDEPPCCWWRRELEQCLEKAGLTLLCESSGSLFLPCSLLAESCLFFCSVCLTRCKLDKILWTMWRNECSGQSSVFVSGHLLIVHSCRFAVEPCGLVGPRKVPAGMRCGGLTCCGSSSRALCVHSEHCPPNVRTVRQGACVPVVCWTCGLK